MLRASYLLPPLTSPAPAAAATAATLLCSLRPSLIPSLYFSSHSITSSFSSYSYSCVPCITFPSKSHFHPQHLPCFLKTSSPPMSMSMSFHPRSRHSGISASLSTEASSGSNKEILVQHLLVKEDDLKLLVELQQRIATGEDLSDLAVEYSICPSKDGGGMLGWVRKGQMVPEFEEAAFNAPLNKVVRCKTKFGWHLLQVLSEREGSVLQDIQPDEFHTKMQDPNFFEESQLIDVREPEEVEKASLPGFQVFPLRQFGSWGPEITTKLDPQKDTYVMCHHGMRSLQVAKWLQMQGFMRIYNLTGGIHAYAVKVDPSVPTY